MDGGEARPITDVAGGAGNPVWSPDGTPDRLHQHDQRRRREEAGRSEAGGRAQERRRGRHARGLSRQRQSRLRRQRPPLAHLHRARCRTTPTCKRRQQITDGEFDEGGSQWSPDGATIYFTSTRVAEPYVDERGDELYAVPAAGGAIDEGRRDRRQHRQPRRCRPTASGSRSSARCAASRSAPTASRISGSRTPRRAARRRT